MIAAARGVAVALAALLTAAWLARGPAPAEPAPAPESQQGDLAAQNAACERCHIPEAIEWRGSLHRAAFSNDAFTRSFAREPGPFCQGCHAPHADPNQPPPPWAAENGVACVTCHLADGAVRAATRPRSPTPAPHPLRRSADFEGPAACADCHEFDFPVTRQHPPGRRMQQTVTEHARSEYADLGCADCHMPDRAQGGARRRDHRFAASRDPDRLRAAITVAARRLADDRVQLELAPVAVGHAFPTGDLFRRIELRVEVRAAGGELVGKTIQHLARHFPPRPVTGPAARRPDPIERDDRLTAPTLREIAVPGATAGHTLVWRVTYQRVDHRDPHDPERSSLAGAVVLAEGVLPALAP